MQTIGTNATYNHSFGPSATNGAPLPYSLPPATVDAEAYIEGSMPETAVLSDFSVYEFAARQGFQARVAVEVLGVNESRASHVTRPRCLLGTRIISLRVAIGPLGVGHPGFHLLPVLGNLSGDESRSEDSTFSQQALPGVLLQWQTKGNQFSSCSASCA